MAGKPVHVQLGDDGRPIRIFRTKDWRNYPSEQVQLMDRGKAVGLIREQVWERSIVEDDLTGTEFAECECCGRLIFWHTFEMNEKRPKGAGGGKTGGEVSLENCEALCHACHQGGPDSAHGDRRWQTQKLDPKGS